MSVFERYKQYTISVFIVVLFILFFGRFCLLLGKDNC